MLQPSPPTSLPLQSCGDWLGDRLGEWCDVNRQGAWWNDDQPGDWYNDEQGEAPWQWEAAGLLLLWLVAVCANTGDNAAEVGAAGSWNFCH